MPIFTSIKEVIKTFSKFRFGVHWDVCMNFYVSRCITWSLFTLKSIKLILKTTLSTRSFIWGCRFIDWLKVETRPSFLRYFGMAYRYIKGAHQETKNKKLCEWLLNICMDLLMLLLLPLSQFRAECLSYVTNQAATIFWAMQRVNKIQKSCDYSRVAIIWRSDNCSIMFLYFAGIRNKFVALVSKAMFSSLFQGTVVFRLGAGAWWFARRSETKEERLVTS